MQGSCLILFQILMSTIIYYLMVLIRAMVVDSEIGLDIKLLKSYDNASIKCEGKDIQLITPGQKVAFHLTKPLIRRAVKNMGGGEVSEIYYKDPSYNAKNIYEIMGWEAVQVITKPIECKLVGVNVSKPTLETHEIVNIKATSALNYTANFEEKAVQTVTHTYGLETEITLGTEVAVSVDIEATYRRASGRRYKSMLGTTITKEIIYPLFLKHKLSSQVQPKNKAYTLMTKIHSHLKVRVTYQAEVYGYVFCTYRETHKGHYFWAYRVDTLLKAIGKIPKMIITEYIDLRTITEEGTGIKHNWTPLIK